MKIVPTPYISKRAGKCFQCHVHVVNPRICVKIVVTTTITVTPEAICSKCCTDMIDSVECQNHVKAQFFLRLEQVYRDMPLPNVDVDIQIHAGLVNYLLKYKPKELVFFGRERI